MRRLWLACGVLTAISASGSPARACEPARASTTTEALPEAWRASLDELIAATRDPAQPWGCPGGVLSLVLEDSGATLRVERDGVEAMTRRVETPEDLVPIGKATLAEPVPIRSGHLAMPAPARTAVITNERAPDEPTADVGDEDVVGPAAPARARLEATGAARYAGITRLMMLGGGLRGTLPIGDWYGALALRYTTMATDLRSDVPELGVWELGMMGAFGYSLIRDPVRLDLGLVGGVAIVDMSAVGNVEDEADEAGEQDGEDQVEGSVVDGKMGMELRLSIPLIDVLNAVVAIDADLAFASLGNADRRIDPSLPPAPAYSLGLSVGLEVGVP